MIRFYYGSGSPFAWRVWLSLEHKALKYDRREVSFSGGDLKTPEYLEINPRGKVPAIVDDGFTLYESAAIVEYLEDRYHDSGRLLFPGNAGARAQIRRLINEADLYLDLANRKLLQAVLFTKKEDWDEARIARGREAVAAELERFEKMLTGQYFGDDLSAADFTIYPMVALLRRLDLRKRDLDATSLIGPKMSAWMAHLETMPLFADTWPPHWKKK